MVEANDDQWDQAGSDGDDAAWDEAFEEEEGEDPQAQYFKIK